MEALNFLKGPQPQRLFVVTGDEDFLRRLVHRAIRKLVLGDGSGEVDAEFSFSSHAGETATFAEVMDELQTVPFFGDRRLVVVERADPFVTRYRSALEKAVTQLPATGTLVLDVKSWTSTTRLAKLVDAEATIVCKGLGTDALHRWCIKWTTDHHQKQLSSAAADSLVELIGPEMGILDQELEKLTVYVGNRKRIEEQDVDTLVARGRTGDVWKILDAISASQSEAALTMLDRLLNEGEEPLRLLGALGWQLRRLAQAYRLTLQGRPLSVAIGEVGLGYRAKQAEQQLRHLGRRRAEQLYDWLLEVNQGVKGASELPPRTLLERLVVRLALAAPK
jgi:DNA polymerase III subunit delta